MRYRRSALGFGWIFLNLTLFIFAVGLVYSKLLGQNMREFLPFLTIGLVGWGYITSSIVEGGNAFVASEGYIKQIGLPIYVYVFRFFVSITATLLISIPAYLIIAFIYSVKFGWGVLWVLPGILLLSMTSFLMIAIFAHLHARFRDIGHLASLGLQVMFFVTPVLWPAEMLSKGGMRWIIDINPLYHLLELIRRPLLMSQPAPDLSYAFVMILIGVLSWVAWVFTRLYSERIVYFL